MEAARRTTNRHAKGKPQGTQGENLPLEPSTRALLEEIVRELEFEGPVRWKPVIDKLRKLL